MVPGPGPISLQPHPQPRPSHRLHAPRCSREYVAHGACPQAACSGQTLGLGRSGPGGLQGLRPPWSGHTGQDSRMLP